MKFHLDINIPKLEPAVAHNDRIVLIGSCFTEHMSGFMNKVKFQTIQNSHGILFNPASVCKALSDVIQKKEYTPNDLFQLDEYWHSWYHHSDFSALDIDDSLSRINQHIANHHEFLKSANVLIITLGSAFVYRLLDQNILVSNNHRAPAAWFQKELLTIDIMRHQLQQLHDELLAFNPLLRIIYTISPVRHIRDGVIENNRSKARLLEVVHGLPNVYYFPAYELVIDVLRDYRFFDIDLVHPNYAATSYVWDQFVTHCIDPSCIPLLKQLEQIHKARQHRPKDTRSKAHQKFLQDHFELCVSLTNTFPYLDLSDELTYFGEPI
jgi:hypothetical protein